MDEELKALLAKAQSNLDATIAKYDLLVVKQADAETKNEKIATEFATQAANHASSMDEMKNICADLEVKIKAQIVPGTTVTKGQVDEGIKKAIGDFVKNYRGDKNDKDSAKQFKNHIVSHVKNALNLTETGFGLESVDEVLSRAIIERARESYPILGAIGYRNMPRSLREEVLVGFPSVQQGLENVPGSNIAETTVQEYREVVNQISKVNAKPRLTDEAMLGSDLDLYGKLMMLLDDEIGRYTLMQVLFGNGGTKNMRGILSSNRLDIVNTTGQSFKPTFAPDPDDARDVDVYPALPTGIAGDVAATDKALVDWLIDFTTTLPSRYLQGGKWYFNRKFLNRVMKVRDNDDRPIFAAGYMGETLSLMGYPVVIDDTMPDFDVADAPFVIFGNLAEAFYISPGAIDKILPDPYSVDGCLVIKIDKEFYEIVGKNDAILIGVSTTNSGA